MFNIGDEVIITDFPRFEDDPGLNVEMREYKGVQTKIKSVSEQSDKWYILENCSNWFWDGRWLEPVANEILLQINENEIMTLFEEQ